MRVPTRVAPTHSPGAHPLGGYGAGMSISRKSEAPAGIVNASGQPEIVIELDGLVLSMRPPATGEAATAAPATPPDETPSAEA